MKSVGVRPNTVFNSEIADEVSILADAVLGQSAGVDRAVQFIRPYALPDLDDAEIRRIVEGECFSVVGEVLLDGRIRSHLEKRGSEILRDRRATLQAMRKLLKDLEDELDHCLSTQQKHKVDLRSDAQKLGAAVKSLQKSIFTVAELIQSEEEGLKHSAPNSKVFSAEYVRAMRRAWYRITGKSPGVAKRLVVDFALELWEGVGLPDHGSKTPTRDWLGERFGNIR